MNKKAANDLCGYLNLVIHNRNLYRFGRRYVNAHVRKVGGKFEVRVEDLHAPVLADDPTMAFVNDGYWADGNGKQVLVSADFVAHGFAN